MAGRGFALKNAWLELDLEVLRDESRPKSRQDVGRQPSKELVGVEIGVDGSSAHGARMERQRNSREDRLMESMSRLSRRGGLRSRVTMR